MKKKYLTKQEALDAIEDYKTRGRPIFGIDRLLVVENGMFEPDMEGILDLGDPPPQDCHKIAQDFIRSFESGLFEITT